MSKQKNFIKRVLKASDRANFRNLNNKISVSNKTEILLGVKTKDTKEKIIMEFLKKGIENCPYCKQKLESNQDRAWCNTEGCNKNFVLFNFTKEDLNHE